MTLEQLEELSQEELQECFYNHLYKTRFIDPKIIKLIINLGANINAVDEGGFNSLFHAIKTANIEVTQFLLDKKVDIDAIDCWGRTPVYFALCQLIHYNRNIWILGDYIDPTIDIINTLLDFGANPNFQDMRVNRYYDLTNLPNHLKISKDDMFVKTILKFIQIQYPRKNLKIPPKGCIEFIPWSFTLDIDPMRYNPNG